MKAYKKRMKGSWTQGKRCKGDGEERQFARREIKAELAAAEDNYMEKYHKGARRRNKRARLEYRVKWYLSVIESRGSWGSSFTSYFRSSLEKAKAELAQLIEEEKANADA